MTGFNMTETMIGMHEIISKEKTFPFKFEINWGPKDILSWINPKSENFLVNDVSGHIYAEGLCDKTEVNGKLYLNYFKNNSIRYDFSFRVDGELYRYIGEKSNIKLWNLPFSHTTCFGTIVSTWDNRLISRSVSYFKLSGALDFLKSFKINEQ